MVDSPHIALKVGRNLFLKLVVNILISIAVVQNLIVHLSSLG